MYAYAKMPQSANKVDLGTKGGLHGWLPPCVMSRSGDRFATGVHPLTSVALSGCGDMAFEMAPCSWDSRVRKN
eukprot:5874732-Amphidinium_carterae.1